jgi:5-hydroxyisourate hydrolase
MGRLTTHVLDIAAGSPAQGLAIELLRVEGERGRVVQRIETNADGRCDKPLLEGDALTVGEWELAFHVADYYRSRGATLPDPPFLDVVRVRFGVSSAAQHYHVPLLVSPWSYSTYRGS